MEYNKTFEKTYDWRIIIQNFTMISQLIRDMEKQPKSRVRGTNNKQLYIMFYNLMTALQNLVTNISKIISQYKIND